MRITYIVVSLLLNVVCLYGHASNAYSEYVHDGQFAESELELDVRLHYYAIVAPLPARTPQPVRQPEPPRIPICSRSEGISPDLSYVHTPPSRQAVQNWPPFFDSPEYARMQSTYRAPLQPIAGVFQPELLPSVSACRKMTEPHLRHHLQQVCGGPLDQYHNELLALHAYYDCQAFRQIVREFPGYHSYITRQYRTLTNRGVRSTVYNWWIGFTSERVTQLYHESVQRERHKEAMRLLDERHTEEQKQHAHEQAVRLKQHEEEQRETARVCEDALPMMQLLLEDEPTSTDEWYNQQKEKRTEAVRVFCEGKRDPYHQTYTLNADTLTLFDQYDDLSVQSYQSCYGNIVQQTLHDECLTLLYQLTQTDTYMIEYQDSLVSCTESARLYNQIGVVDKSMALLDWGAALFLCTKQIVTAATQGVFQGVGDLFHDPVQLGIAAVAPQYLLPYQLGRVVYTVADISMRALTHWDQTKQEMQNWIEPLIGALDQIATGNVSVYDAVQTGTRLAVSMKAQTLFCKGMKGFCQITKSKLKYNNGKSPGQCKNSMQSIQPTVSLPRFIKENVVPEDCETILKSKGFAKTKIPKVKGAIVYKNEKRYFHRDTFHRGKSAHLEVYDYRGNHIGEVDPITGILRPNTQDKIKKLYI